MIGKLVTAILLVWSTMQSPPHTADPLEKALAYHSNMNAYVANIRAAEQLEAERALELKQTSRTIDRDEQTSSLPSLLQTIRTNESHGNYSAYNASGCEGYGCGGAYQLHAKYASVWAARAGYPGMSGAAQTWSPEIQDAVALKLFYSTNPDGAHWCNWTSYC